ncbi:hypothetical protein [Sulfuricurvum sp.]|nr:hypothetical protein [Sulfuricurvum sp.]MDD2780073.1 hypothetical protein [Sulfuricurvum sp.]
MKSLLLLTLALVMIVGCSTHTSDSNKKMMDNVIGELDRETAK